MQKTVYILVDDGPEDWGHDIRDIGFFSKSSADKEINKLRAEKPYENQYLTVKPILIKSD